MRATLLGHACWLFETTVGCFLMDPVLFDPFEEGTVTACPRRAVRVDQLPGLQGIVVSHRHLDHFDLPSLAALDRCVPVFALTIPSSSTVCSAWFSPCAPTGARRAAAARGATAPATRLCTARCWNTGSCGRMRLGQSSIRSIRSWRQRLSTGCDVSGPARRPPGDVRQPEFSLL